MCCLLSYSDLCWDWIAIVTRQGFFYPDFRVPHRIQHIGTLGDGGKWVCGLDHLAQQDKCIRKTWFYFLVLIALFLLATSKESSLRKSTEYLSQDIPFTFYDFFSTFQYFFTIFSGNIPKICTFFVLFWTFLCFWPNLLWKSEVLFYFFYKKAPKSKNQVFLMLSGGPIIW